MEPDGRVKIRDDVFFLKFFKTFSYYSTLPSTRKKELPGIFSHNIAQNYEIVFLPLHGGERA